RERQAAADDRRGVQDALVGDRDVKGARPPLAVAVGPPDDLGQRASHVAAARDDVAVVAVRRPDVVVRTERRRGRRARRLLAHVDVVVAAQQALVLLPEVHHLLFHAPHPQHRAQQVHRLLWGEWRCHSATSSGPRLTPASRPPARPRLAQRAAPAAMAAAPVGRPRAAPRPAFYSRRSPVATAGRPGVPSTAGAASASAPPRPALPPP